MGIVVVGVSRAVAHMAAASETAKTAADAFERRRQLRPPQLQATSPTRVMRRSRRRFMVGHRHHRRAHEQDHAVATCIDARRRSREGRAFFVLVNTNQLKPWRNASARNLPGPLCWQFGHCPVEQSPRMNSELPRCPNVSKSASIPRYRGTVLLRRLRTQVHVYCTGGLCIEALGCKETSGGATSGRRRGSGRTQPSGPSRGLWSGSRATSWH